MARNSQWLNCMEGKVQQIWQHIQYSGSCWTDLPGPKLVWEPERYVWAMRTSKDLGTTEIEGTSLVLSCALPRTNEHNGSFSDFRTYCITKFRQTLVPKKMCSVIFREMHNSLPAVALRWKRRFTDSISASTGLSSFTLLKCRRSFSTCKEGT